VHGTQHARRGVARLLLGGHRIVSGLCHSAVYLLSMEYALRSVRVSSLTDDACATCRIAIGLSARVSVRFFTFIALISFVVRGLLSGERGCRPQNESQKSLGRLVPAPWSLLPLAPTRDWLVVLRAPLSPLPSPRPARGAAPRSARATRHGTAPAQPAAWQWHSLSNQLSISISTRRVRFCISLLYRFLAILYIYWLVL
jgi:hypothetical protein